MSIIEVYVNSVSTIIIPILLQYFGKIDNSQKVIDQNSNTLITVLSEVEVKRTVPVC